MAQTAKTISDLIRPDAPASAARAALGLGNVDDTTDTAKPVSAATRAALDLKAPLASPTFTGTISGDGSGLARLAGAAVATSGGALGAGYRAGAWLAPYATSITTSAPGPAVAMASPIHVPAACAIDRIACEVVTAGSTRAVVRLGIYADNGSGYPGSLALDAGTVDAATIGLKVVTINKALAAGRYWLVACSQGAPTTPPWLRSHAGNAPPVLGPTSSALLSTLPAAYTMAATTGALPSTWSETLAIVISCPRVTVRFV